MNSNTDMSEVMARRHVEPRFQASSVGWIPGPEAGWRLVRFDGTVDGSEIPSIPNHRLDV